MTWRRVGVALLLVAVCVGVLMTRVFWDGRRALAAGAAAMARGDTEEAIAEWRRAARWYAPGAPHVRAAYGRLEDAARRAEDAGDRQGALAAWRAVRSSVLATRSFYTPYAEKLGVANDRIAGLMKDVEGDAADPGKTPAQREAWHLALLTRDEAPSVGWTLLALVGLAGWIGGGFLFAFRGVTDEDRLDRRFAAYSGLLVAAGLFVRMLGLYLA